MNDLDQKAISVVNTLAGSLANKKIINCFAIYDKEIAHTDGSTTLNRNLVYIVDKEPNITVDKVSTGIGEFLESLNSNRIRFAQIITNLDSDNPNKRCYYRIWVRWQNGKYVYSLEKAEENLQIELTELIGVDD